MMNEQAVAETVEVEERADLLAAVSRLDRLGALTKLLGEDIRDGATARRRLIVAGALARGWLTLVTRLGETWESTYIHLERWDNAVELRQARAGLSQIRDQLAAYAETEAILEAGPFRRMVQTRVAHFTTTLVTASLFHAVNRRLRELEAAKPNVVEEEVGGAV